MIINKGDATIITGTLPRDADYQLVKCTIPLCKFGVKADERGDDRQAVWVNCVCWRGVAEATATLKKGDTILAAGKVQTRTWTGRDGEPKEAKDLVCDYVVKMRIPPKLDESTFPGATFTDTTDEEDPDDLPF